MPSSFSKDAWAVLCLFIIPVGGGIPGGVLLAQARGLGWPIMAVLYLISDVMLACVFEPLLLLVIRLGQRSERSRRMIAAMKEAIAKTTPKFGTPAGPWALIMISFGIDPMTGRTATAAAGHGFVSGWTLAILGDMMFFAVIMVSTLWLKSVLGDGTWTTLIILALMFLVPMLVRRFREKFGAKRA